MKEKQVYFRIDSQELKKLCMVLGKYQDNMLIHADVEGISCMQVESNNISLIDIRIPYHALEDYSCIIPEKEEKMRFVLPCVALKKGFLPTTEGMVSVSVFEDRITFETEINRTEYVRDPDAVRRMARYDYPDYPSYRLIKSMDYKGFLEFKKYIDSLKKVTDLVKISGLEHDFILESYSEECDQVSFRLDGFYTDVKQSAFFKIKYLKAIVDSIKTLKPKKIEIRLLQDYPIIISCDLNGYHDCVFLVAPRIENEN